MTTNHSMTCPICNKLYTSDNLGICCGSLIAHGRTAHGLNVKESVSKFNIDVDAYNAYKKHQCQYSKRKLRDPNYINETNTKLIAKIGLDEFNKLPKCQLCEYRGKQLYKHISTIHDMSVSEYKSKYNTQLETKEYLEYLSTSRTGDKNPMYNNGSSECSPWSIEFYIKKGYTIDEATKLKQEFITTVNTNKSNDCQPTHVEYYIKKYNIDYAEALSMLIERQKTNSVDSIATRNNISLQDAQIIRDNITQKWCETISNKSEDELVEMNRKKLARHSVSKISKSFITHLLKFTNINPDETLYDSNELTLIKYNTDNTLGHKCYMYDFTYKNKIIEFNGDMIHANPSIYSENDTPLAKFNKVFVNRANWTAKMLWDYDYIKKIHAESHGYNVLAIWESEWKQNKEDVLRKCKEFLGV